MSSEPDRTRPKPLRGTYHWEQPCAQLDSAVSEFHLIVSFYLFLSCAVCSAVVFGNTRNGVKSMGGIGSGRWQRPDTRLTTEDCLPLRVCDLTRNGFFQPGSIGQLFWTNTATKVCRASLSFHVTSIQNNAIVIGLSYIFDNSEAIRDSITLQYTQPHFGGLRPWLTCGPCGRRVGNLYLFGAHFRCRHCHRLTYRSCQESHQLERMMARILKRRCHL